jgi:hypothetical protein
MDQEFFIQSLELKAIWLLKSQQRTMMVLKLIFLQQELFCLLCMLVIPHLRKQLLTIHITNLLNKKTMLLFGKHTQEEDHLIILVRVSKICLFEWQHSISMKDQLFNKFLSMHGSLGTYALKMKLNNNLVTDYKN